MGQDKHNGKREESKVDFKGRWLGIPFRFLRSERCVSLSPHGAKLLLDAFSMLGMLGKNNGDLSFAPSMMIHRGWTSRTTLGAAIKELLDAKLLHVTRQGSKRHAYLYALTLWKIDRDRNVVCKLDVGRKGLNMYDVADEASWGPVVDSEHPVTWKRPRKRPEETQSVTPQRDEGPELDPAAGRAGGGNLEDRPAAGQQMHV